MLSKVIFFSSFALVYAAAANALDAAALKEIKLTNKVYGDSMSYSLGNPVVVDYKGSSEDSVKYWFAEEAPFQGYKLKNSFSESWVSIAEDDILASLTKEDADVFFFQPAENGSYVIKLPDEDLVWDVLPPADDDCYAGAVRMRPANGELSQRWLIST